MTIRTHTGAAYTAEIRALCRQQLDRARRRQDGYTRVLQLCEINRRDDKAAAYQLHLGAAQRETQYWAAHVETADAVERLTQSETRAA